MATTKNKISNTGANLGFEAKFWATADALRNNTQQERCFQPEPIGRHPIQHVSQISIHNLGAKRIGHMDYKRQLQGVARGS
jgi:hypothetical protein